MNKHTWKSLLSLLLCLVLALSLCACGSDGGSDSSGSNNNAGSSSDKPSDDPSDDPSDKPSAGTTVNTDATTLEADDLSYVMIYNPNIYDELKAIDNSYRNTGDFGTQVNVDAVRGDGLGGTQYRYNADFYDIAEEMKDIELNRADGLAKIYKVGDTNEFYVNHPNTPAKIDFTCAYVGEHCYIWTYGTKMTDAQIKDYAEAFDDKIFDKMTETFGDPRYDDKVHFLFYPLGASLGGYSYAYDLFSSSEVTAMEIQKYAINTNVNVLHINSNFAEMDSEKEFITSTLAHEYQHLLIASAAFENAAPKLYFMRSWLNEAMSGYTEEMLFDGIQEDNGRYKAFARSNLIRHGQSLYNFLTVTDSYDDFDIGVYGSVFIFSEYLADLAGDDVFSKIHTYWRDFYGEVPSESEALVEAMPSDAYDKVDAVITYPEEVEFEDEYEEWMSKMTLDFYLSLLKYDAGDPDAFEPVDAQTLLYDEINGTDIEGGGRVIAAINGNSFEIPEDAQEGLIYIGLNEDFEIVTEYVYR